VLDSPGTTTVFARYVVCMHAHGVRHVPARTSPVMLLKALEASNTTYRTANLACYMTLEAANQAIAGRCPPGAPGRSSGLLLCGEAWPRGWANHTQHKQTPTDEPHGPMILSRR
jgi:hypothetical protein